MDTTNTSDFLNAISILSVMLLRDFTLLFIFKNYLSILHHVTLLKYLIVNQIVYPPFLKFYTTIMLFSYIVNEPQFDVQILLTPLPSLLSSIKHLDIDIYKKFSPARNLADLIRSQTQLLSITFYSSITLDILDALK